MLPRATGLDGGQIYVIKIWLLQILSAALTYGFFLCLGIMTIYTVIQRGLQGNKSRQALLALIMVMLIGATAHLVLYVLLFVFQLQLPGLEDDGRHDRRVQAILLVQTFIRRITYFLSDIIVAWRAWVIWPKSRVVHVVLVFCLVGTFGTSLTLAIWNYKSRFQHRHYQSLAQNFLGTFPLLLTNFVSTALISYKLCYYRQNIKVHLNRAGSSRKTKVEGVLILLMESGWLYLAFWVLLMVGDFGYFGPDFGFEWFQPNISGMYPTAIIFLVSRQMMMGEDLIETEILLSESFTARSAAERTVDQTRSHHGAAATIWFGRRSGTRTVNEGGGRDSIALSLRHPTSTASMKESDS
ncbi:hypothetical protein FB45DRAFT_317538 [Roridomyces roridus]|uniref:Uncharacterized protein n=1 Tax=Roridomyces roridus TaxID=1738132 RepID=A0AAD7F831_9AGAR|nr:hypothetical protein FB45DRAFT_64578 [Roridomyces roridus]KAJ7611833.1 hypothetical protein FB45DRAFT_317538 [Roridomyces roridus]